VSDASCLAHVTNASLDAQTELQSAGPGHRGLEGLGNHSVLEAQIANVCNHVRQEVTASAVLSISLEAGELLGNGEHFLLLRLDDLLGALEHNCGSAELCGVKAVVFGDVELLGFFNQRRQKSSSSRLNVRMSEHSANN
jgi:hypothetical protein